MENIKRRNQEINKRNIKIKKNIKNKRNIKKVLNYDFYNLLTKQILV
jgi:hypothetical protein